MRRLLRTRGGRGDDRGAVIPIVALLLFALLAVTAIVVDLGYARATRRDNQATADLAALAAGFNLAGGGSARLDASPAAACRSAVNSLLENLEGIPPTASITPDCNTLPKSVSLCTSSDDHLIRSVNADPYDITIEWPVEDAEIARTEFDGSLDDPSPTADAGSMDGNRCERMRVTVTRDNAPLFEGVLGGDGETVTASATVRASNFGDNTAIPALLLLEREDCGTLQVSGQGAVEVKASRDVYGVIHSDTAAEAPPCSNVNNQTGYGIYGTSRPSGGPSIIAEGTATRPGKISIYALRAGGANANRAASFYSDDPVATGLSVPATPGNIMSRRIVDDHFNDPEVGTFITNTHQWGYYLATSAERTGFTTEAQAVQLDDYLTNNAVLGGPNMCVARDAKCWEVISGARCSLPGQVYQGRDTGPGLQADNYFVLCDEFNADQTVFRNGIRRVGGADEFRLPNGASYGRVVFSGKVSNSGANSCAVISAATADLMRQCAHYLAIPSADEVFIRGCIRACNGSGGFALDSRGLIAINGGEDLSLAWGGAPVVVDRTRLDSGLAPTTWPYLNCIKTRLGKGDGGSWNQWTKVATFNGAMTANNGTFSLCQTSVYVGKNTPSYSMNTRTSGYNCSEQLPCPTDDGTNGLVSINSGSALSVSWQAPNQTTEGPGVTSPLEDLALWTEGGGDAGECIIAGQGAMKAGGIFFHPNCALTYGGQTDNDNPLNAQFIGRSLNVSGKGKLSLRPSVNDSIEVPIGGDVILIR